MGNNQKKRAKAQVEYKSKQERLQHVIEICKKLRHFPISAVYRNESLYMDLYSSEYQAIVTIKKVFHDYVNQDDDTCTLRGFSGKIPFPEIGRKIEYILPIKKYANPLFVLRAP